jgi:Cysteine-rich secretory protein family
MAVPDMPQTEAAIIEMTNAFRAENRLAAVKPNGTLAKAAKAFAEYLAQTGKFAHEADGRRPVQRTQAAGYKHCIVAENLAMNQDSRGFETRGLARQAVEGWKGSPPHRAAMLNPHVTEIGVGIARAADSAPKFLSVQLFGRPQSLQYSFRIENKAGAPISYTLNGKPQNVATNTAVEHTECVPNTLAIPSLGRTYTASDGTVLVIKLVSDGITVEIAGSKSP